MDLYEMNINMFILVLLLWLLVSESQKGFATDYDVVYRHLLSPLFPLAVHQGR